MPPPCPPGCGCGKHNTKSATSGPPCAVCGGPTGAQNTTGVCRRNKACRSAYHQLRTAEQRRAEYERNRDYYTERNYRAQHGLTLAEYEEMLAAQDGRCAICGTDQPGGKHGKRFHIDHDHSCCPKGKTCEKCRRGLLCANCNVGLGALGDDPDRLLAAASYLLSHGKGRPE